MSPVDASVAQRMMTYKEVVRYLNWRANQMREDAEKARKLHGQASDLFARALETSAIALEYSSRAIDKEFAKTSEEVTKS